jgi:hypothetical protein
MGPYNRNVTYARIPGLCTVGEWSVSDSRRKVPVRGNGQLPGWAWAWLHSVQKYQCPEECIF